MTLATYTQPGIKKALKTGFQLLGIFLREEYGQDLIEYALVFSFVALGAIASMKSLSATIATVFSSVGNTLTSAT